MAVPTSSASQYPCGWPGARRRKGGETLALATQSGRRAQRQAPPRLTDSARDCSYPGDAFRATRLAVNNPGKNSPETKAAPAESGLLRVFEHDSVFSMRRLFLLDHGILWPRRKTFVVFQCFLGQLNRFFELRIVAGDNEIRPLRHNEVRIDAVILHDPFAAIVRRPERSFRRGNVAAVVQRDTAEDAHESAPGARADDRPDFLPVEEPREGVAAGAGEFIDDHDLWTVDRHGRPRNVFSFARRKRREEFAAQFLRIKIRNLPTRIVTFVND